MKEEVCEKIIQKRKEDRIRLFFKTADDKYKISFWNDETMFNVDIYLRKKNFFGKGYTDYRWSALYAPHLLRIRMVDNFSDMTVYDKSLYELAKKFGKEYKIQTLYKCWDGVLD